MNLNLLDEVKNIIKRNEDEINKTGKGFNLISILGMENNERYTHSNIIAELLNAKGSHTFGNKFFELFLEQVGISDFSTSNYEVLTEEYVGSISCSDGSSMRTFLDVVVKDKNTGKVILIENKIWAEDQPYQIERYYDKYKEKIVKLLYLNVNVWNDIPTNRPEILNVFQNISYKKDIKNWLANCIVASSEKPYVSKQIEAYYQTILKITKQDIYKKMSKDIKNYIIENQLLKEYYELISQKDIIEFEIVKRFVEQSCDVKINDLSFGGKGSSFNLLEHNEIIVFLCFEKRLEDLYICIEAPEGRDVLFIKEKLKLDFKAEPANHRIYLFFEQYNKCSWENLLDESNVESMKQLVNNIKKAVSSIT